MAGYCLLCNKDTMMLQAKKQQMITLKVAIQNIALLCSMAERIYTCVIVYIYNITYININKYI